MPQYIVGDTVEDYFTLVNSSGTRIPGQVFTTGATIDPNGAAFTLTVTEVGDGVYKVSFVPTEEGTYYYRIDSTTISPAQSFEETFTITLADVFGSTVGDAAYGNTLGDLIRATATSLGDFLEIEATQDGTESSFIDELRLASIPTNAMQGAAIYIAGPHTTNNYQRETRIRESSSANRSLSLDPSFEYITLQGDEGWVTNLYSRGYWRNQYRSAINNAVLSSSGTRVTVDYTHGTSFDPATPYIERPSHLITLYGIEATDGEGTTYQLELDTGYYYDKANERIMITDYWQEAINGYSIRLLGTGRPVRLVNDDDYTTIDFEYIVETASAQLKLGKGDQRELAAASMKYNRSDSALLKTLTPYFPNEIRLV